MTLDEAILHAHKQAHELEGTECGREHAQLAMWLSELKELREGPSKANPEEAVELVAEQNPDAVRFDNLDRAIMGLAQSFGRDTVLAYDYEECIRVFVDEGMTPEEAEEWMSYNVLGTGVDHAPVFVSRVRGS